MGQNPNPSFRRKPESMAAGAGGYMAWIKGMKGILVIGGILTAPNRYSNPPTVIPAKAGILPRDLPLR